MERLKEALNYGYSSAKSATLAVLDNGDLVAAVLFVMLLTWMVVIGRRTWKNGEGLRDMAKTRLLEEKRMIADGITCLLLNLHDKGKLTPERVNYWTKKLGNSADISDLIPRKSVKDLKNRLKRRRKSPNGIKEREKENAPVEIPGPKPGEDIVVKTKEVVRNVTELFKPGKSAA